MPLKAFERTSDSGSEGLAIIKTILLPTKSRLKPQKHSLCVKDVKKQEKPYHIFILSKLPI